MNALFMREPEVLIIGAGPAGLVLALWLTRLGVRVRIVDRLDAPQKTSRAIGVQARTLEYYRQINFADIVIAHGRKAPATNLWVSGRNAARLCFQDMGADISPFPFALALSQDEHESLLIEQLAELGVPVERQTELLDLQEQEDGIRVCLRHGDGTHELCETAFMAGCDGARSTVRQTLNIPFAGDTYARRFYVADVQASGPGMDGEMHVALDEADFLAIFPLKAEGCARLIGTLHDKAESQNGNAVWEDTNQHVIKQLGMQIDRINWFSSYRVHHRIADRFRRGRAFLVGDAAHIHTPVGGQGMNTGIGDAVNLAWKLAAVLRHRMAPSLLDTYETERMAFARRLVEATDRVFASVTSSNTIDRQVRLNIVPALLPLMFKLPLVRHFLFRTISQAAIHYRGSGLSEGRAGAVHGGDRLPWVKPDASRSGDNFTPLTSLDWQIHVYGDCTRETRAVCAERRLPLHVFPWCTEMSRTGLQRNAVYLLRPDGHIALATSEGQAEAITMYLDARKLSVTS